MTKRHPLTAFYVEAALLLLLTAAMLATLAGVFARAGAQSRKAAQLSAAVRLAQNAAEAFAASGDPEELLLLLNENQNASRNEDGLLARYDTDGRADPKGTLRMTLRWSGTPNARGNLQHAVITVLTPQGEAIYTLETAAFREEAPR